MLASYDSSRSRFLDFIDMYPLSERATRNSKLKPFAISECNTDLLPSSESHVRLSVSQSAKHSEAFVS